MANGKKDRDVRNTERRARAREVPGFREKKEGERSVVHWGKNFEQPPKRSARRKKRSKTLGSHAAGTKTGKLRGLFPNLVFGGLVLNWVCFGRTWAFLVPEKPNLLQGDAGGKKQQKQTRNRGLRSQTASRGEYQKPEKTPTPTSRRGTSCRGGAGR